MSSETWKLETALCRCCHSEGLFKNLAEPCVNLCQEEIYSDMLRDCFDIEVLPVPGMLCLVTYMICDSCITRLRDAYNFKKQVVACETRFWDMYNRNILTVSDNNVKLKVKIELDLDSDQDGGKPKAVAKAAKNDGTRQSGLLFQYLTKDRDYKEDLSTGDNEVFSDSYSAKYDEGDSEDTQETVKKKQKKDKTVKKKSTAKESKKEKIKAEKQEIKEEAPKKKDGRCQGLPEYDSMLIMSKEDGTVYYNCKKCGNRFKTRNCFTQHVKHVHMKQRPKYRSCQQCSERVPGYLRAYHMEAAHGVPAPQCNACGKKFAYPFLVLRHQKIYHMGEKSISCDICDCKFVSENGLKRHMPKHSGSRPYKCNLCDKGFKWKKNLKTHLMIHFDERHHVCVVCEEAFVQSSSLKYHIAKRHPELV